MLHRHDYLQFLRLVFVFGLFLIPNEALAADSAEEPNDILMTGQGEVLAMPDEADVVAGAVTQAPTAGAAVIANAEIVNRCVAKLKQLGALEKSISVSGFQLEPIFQPQDPKKPHPSTIIGYEVTNSVSVKLDDVTRVGAMLDALIAAGANRSIGVSFNIKNKQPLLDQARAIAAKDALKRAQIYANSVGATLGPVRAIREGYPVEGRSSYRGGDIQTVPISITALSQEQMTQVQVGEQGVSAIVTIVWGIK